MLHSSLLWIGSLVALAAAQGSAQCTSGEVVCCNIVQNANDVPDLTSTTGMSNAAAANLGLVGSACTTLTVIRQGLSCATKQIPMCCTDNNYNGTVSLGCTYINPIVVQSEGSPMLP